MTAKYRFMLMTPTNPADGYSWAKTGTLVCDLSPKAVSVTKALNRAGQVQLTVLQEELRDAHAAFPSVWKGNLVPGAATLWIQRDHKMIFGGLVWDIDMQSGSQTATITGEEFIGYYDHLELSTAFSGNLVGASPGSIIRTLLAHEGVNSIQMKPWDFSDVTGNTVYLSGTYVPRWYEWQKLKVGDLVRSMLALGNADWMQEINSFDGFGDPLVNGFQTNINFQKAAFWGIFGSGPSGNYYVKGGKDWEAAPGYQIEYGSISGSGSSSPPTPAYPWVAPCFEWGSGTRQTIHSYRLTHSARKTGNRVRVGGYGSQGTQLHQRYLLAYFERLGVPFLDASSDDPQLGTQGAVDARAKAMISMTGLPALTMTAKVLQPNPMCSYDDVGIGDRVRVTIKDKALTWTGKLRVSAITIQLDDRGNEWMNVDLAPDTAAYQ